MRSDVFPYSCECGNRRCKRRVRMTRAEYKRRAADGPVVMAGCPTLLRANKEALEAWNGTANALEVAARP
jgi:hypothetical protein